MEPEAGFGIVRIALGNKQQQGFRLLHSQLKMCCPPARFPLQCCSGTSPLERSDLLGFLSPCVFLSVVYPSCQACLVGRMKLKRKRLQ